MPTSNEDAAQRAAREEACRQVYLEHCGTWGGFDSPEHAEEWAEQSTRFSEQVDEFTQLLVSQREAGIREAMDAVETALTERIGREEYGHAKAAVTNDLLAVDDVRRALLDDDGGKNDDR